MGVVRERDMWRGRCERVQAENARLRKALGKVRRTALETPFGAHTPSGKRLAECQGTSALGRAGSVRDEATGAEAVGVGGSRG